MGTKTSYFASANSSQGFVSYFDYVLKGAEKVYIIKGGPGCGKSTFMKKIGEDLLEAGYDVDFVWCSADRDSLDAIVVPEMKLVMVDGTAPHVTEY
jgi:ABC-type lipoprotein export system ATPase subunit